MCRLVLMIYKALLLVVSQFLLWSTMIAQQSNPAPLKLGIGLSSYSYTGDLIESGDQFRRFYPGGNFSLQFAGKKAIQMQMNAGFGRFAEQTDLNLLPGNNEVVPNHFVETSFFYTDFRLKLWFFRRRFLRPFIGGGIGMLFFNPRDAEGNFLSENIFTRLEGEEYNTSVGSFPVVGGLEMVISPVISLGAEYIYRFTPTDYLDNIGRLGPVEGNDGLHAIQISLLVTLNPEYKPLPPQEDLLPHPPVSQDWGISSASTAEMVIPARGTPPKHRGRFWQKLKKVFRKKSK